MRTFGTKTTAAVGVVVCAAAWLSGCGGNARADTVASPVAADASLIPITVFTAIKRDVPTVVRVTGTFTADESSDVAARSAGCHPAVGRRCSDLRHRQSGPAVAAARRP